MRKILALTVGGSLQPLITAINSVGPEFVIFICSEDTTQIKGSYTNVPEILKETGDINHDIITVNPDDPENCISKILGKLKETKEHYPESNLMVDYTGGTKTMSASLFWVAVHLNLEICLTTGIRRNLVAVEEGETTRKFHLSFPYYEELIQSVNDLLRNFHYKSAEEMLRAALANYSFSIELQEDLQKKFEIISIFRLWDDYDSLSAFVKAKPYRKELWQDYLSFWDKVIGDRMKMEEDFREEVKNRKISITYENAPVQYAVVQDLLLNAQRCAVRGRYDDATARLYRALEALAQLRLLSEYNIKTSDVNISLLDQKHLDKYAAKRSDGKIKLGLIEDYELLFEFDDIVGRAYKVKERGLREALSGRNQSILAHGFKSIDKEKFEEIWEIIAGFIKECLKELQGQNYSEPSQLPRSLEEIEKLFSDNSK